MRKELLLRKKEEIKNSIVWYVANTISEDELKIFSISQLETLKSILNKAEQYREERDPFLGLSATEVLQKESGKIAQFVEGVGVKETIVSNR